MEHAFQLLGELIATLHLELRQHAPLSIVRNRPAQKKTFSQMAFVIPFEDVLFCDVAENSDRLVKYNVHLGVGFLWIFIRLQLEDILR